MLLAVHIINALSTLVIMGVILYAAIQLGVFAKDTDEDTDDDQ